MSKYTDNIDHRGHTLQDALAGTDPSDWAWATPVALALSAAADDIIDAGAAHGLTADDVVYFPTLTGGTGLTAATAFYYVIAANLGAQTFQVSATPGGAAVNFSADITAGTVAKLAPAASQVAPTTQAMYLAQTDAEVDAQA